MSVTVKNKINEKWLVGVFPNANNELKPKFTDNKEAAFLFTGMHTAVPILDSLKDYSLSEWAFFEDGKLVEQK